MDDDKSANIYINTGKTLILPPITDWYLFTSIFHEMFNEIDSETGTLLMMMLMLIVMMMMMIIIIITIMIIMMITLMMWSCIDVVARMLMKIII
jgi:hypothetical protein